MSQQDNKNTPWWESNGGFFGSSYMEADNSLEGYLNNPAGLSERTKRETAGVLKLCNLRPGDTLLDCPSGYGRHSLALAQRNIIVTGIDINDSFLEISRDQQKRLNVQNCIFKKGDMRNLDLKDEFNAVINMFYAFGFFETEEEDLQTLQSFYSALKPGGKFLMQTHITLPKILNGDYKQHDIRTLNSGNKLELFRRYDPETKREYGEWSLLKTDGSKETLTPYSVRIYDTTEFEALCHKAGFSKVENFGDWDGNPYSPSSAELIAVATK